MLMMILGHQQKFSDINEEVEHLKLLIQSVTKAKKKQGTRNEQGSVLVNHVEYIPSETLFKCQLCAYESTTNIQLT